MNFWALESFPVPVADEIDRLHKYLSTQSENLHVTIGELPNNRYVVPQSLIILVQNAQRNNVCSPKHPLHINICFHKHHIEVTNNIQPCQHEKKEMAGLRELESLYCSHYNLPIISQTEESFSVCIPLFI